MTTETLSRTALRRKYLPCPLLVVRNAGSSGGRIFFGYARNISSGGLYISTVNPRQPGSQFELEVPVPPLGRCINCLCEVVWKRDFTHDSPYDPGMGMKFIDLDGNVARAIDTWVEEHEMPAAESGD
jgi:uncharacterized protein (TIGR02266 family)